MKSEIELSCDVEECSHCIGGYCLATSVVAINKHGVCVIAGSLPGFQKNEDLKNKIFQENKHE